jgi:pimeloyl-ACP methyl ester carboxylesterase
LPIAEGIAYAEHGGGPRSSGRPPLLLIHGAGGSRLVWPAPLRRLPGSRVFALDLPGHGRSPGPAEETIQAHVARLERWMAQLGLGPVILVGHSMGGAIALQAALSLAQVAGIVLIASGGRLRVDSTLLEGLSHGGGYRQTLRDLNRRWFAPQAQAALLRLSEQRLAEAPREVVEADFRACDRFDVLDRLGEVGVPTLVVCGLLDQMVPEKYCRTLAYGIAGAHLEFVPEAGHMVMLERPEAVAAAVQRFLEREFPV